MNCPEAHDRLAALLYGDLEPTEANPLRAHLANCPACRQEHAALDHLRRALDAVPVPAVQVDHLRLYREAAARQVRAARRWRWAAVACGAAAAALLLLVLGLRLEVRVDAHQLVVRWGAAPKKGADTLRPPAPRVEAPEPPPSPEVEERLRVLSELIHALADDVEARDEYQQERVARLQARLDELQRQGNRRWSEMDRNVAALYAAHFLTKQGEKP
jgi:hypothetical protein